jgi:recombination protein RecR
MATNPNIEGEATVMYIRENLPERWKNIKITRLSKGLPNSGYIEYADEITLINAFKGRN